MKSIIILIALNCVVNVSQTFSQEYTIYDSNYKPKAYLIQTESDILIYSFDGRPFGFLDSEEGDDFAVFGKNGKHLGWLSDGWIYDKSGMIVGFLEGATKMKRVKIPRKEERQRFIFNSLKEITDLRPVFHHKWSKIRLEDLLNSGLVPDEFQQLLKRPAKDKPKIISI